MQTNVLVSPSQQAYSQSIPPLVLAKEYAERFNTSYDTHFAFAAIKHAANALLLNPSIAMSAAGLIEVTVNESVARFERLRHKLGSLIPGATFAEAAADHAQPIGSIFSPNMRKPSPHSHATVSKRRKLIVSLPQKPLSAQELTDMLDHLLYWPEEDNFFEAAFQKWMSRDLSEVSELVAACKQGDRRINQVLESVIVEANESVGYNDEMMERLEYAIQTRRDREFYQTVAESLEYAFLN